VRSQAEIDETVGELKVKEAELDLARQLIVVGICVLGGIGTAGVPAGSLPVVAMILGLVGVPPEGIGIIFGVDRFLDMCRTTLNVTGDITAATYVARSEGYTLLKPEPATVQFE